jgi:hypothetical protein
MARVGVCTLVLLAAAQWSRAELVGGNVTYIVKTTTVFAGGSQQTARASAPSGREAASGGAADICAIFGLGGWAQVELTSQRSDAYFTAQWTEVRQPPS